MRGAIPITRDRRYGRSPGSRINAGWRPKNAVAVGNAIPRIRGPPFPLLGDKEVARRPRPGGRFTLKSRRKLLKRDVAYENAGTVKISAFTRRSLSLSSILSRLHASFSRSPSSSGIAEGARSFMHDRNGLRISSRVSPMRESASFLEGKIPKAPCGHERNFGVFRTLRISRRVLHFCIVKC